VTDPFDGEPMSQHPATEAIAAYLSGALSPPEQTTLETHLSHCRSCRQEVSSARRLVLSRRAPRRWLLMAPLAAAAVLAILLVGRPLRRPEPAGEPARAGYEPGSGVGAGLRALAPVDRDTVTDRRLVFTWSGQAGRLLYRLTVTDASGRAAWLRDTSDTTLVLPAGVSLDPGRTYYWYVDALDAEGRSLTTGTHRFTISP
jgi:anti-sigma factor RsiW